MVIISDNHVIKYDNNAQRKLLSLWNFSVSYLCVCKGALQRLAGRR